MAIEGREFLVADVRPMRADLAKSLHPPFAILAFKASCFPHQEAAATRKQSG